MPSFRNKRLLETIRQTWMKFWIIHDFMHNHGQSLVNAHIFSAKVDPCFWHSFWQRLNVQYTWNSNGFWFACRMLILWSDTWQGCQCFFPWIGRKKTPLQTSGGLRSMVSGLLCQWTDPQRTIWLTLVRRGCRPETRSLTGVPFLHYYYFHVFADLSVIFKRRKHFYG